MDMNLVGEKKTRAKRRPRFSRAVPKNPLLPLSVHADPNYLIVLRLLEHHRLLRTSHFATLLPHLHRLTLYDILRDLYDNEYIDLPEVQKLWLYLRQSDDGKKDQVYALFNRGAHLLHEIDSRPQGRSDWKAKNDVRESFVMHTLMVSDVVVRITEACRLSGNTELIHSHEILGQASSSVKNSPAPFEWKVEIDHENQLYKRKLIPDGVFGLRFTDEPEGRNRAFFFLEADRGTETVYSPNMYKSSIFQKYLKYRETNRQKIHTDRYNIRGFRALFVTTKNDTRVESFVEANKKMNNGVGSRLFYFITYDDLMKAGNPLTATWTNGLGESVTLSD